MVKSYHLLTNVKERIRRGEEKLYNKPNDKLIGSYFRRDN